MFKRLGLCGSIFLGLLYSVKLHVGEFNLLHECINLSSYFLNIKYLKRIKDIPTARECYQAKQRYKHSLIFAT